jgi:hypothetical protein
MCLEKYWTNPQYFVRLNFIDDDDSENLCTMIVALMQKDTRQRRIRGLEGEDYIQFRLFKVRPFCCLKEKRRKNITWSSVFLLTSKALLVVSSCVLWRHRTCRSRTERKRKKGETARDGDRTHAHYCELDLKSNALTTRPPWHNRFRGKDRGHEGKTVSFDDVKDLDSLKYSSSRVESYLCADSLDQRRCGRSGEPWTGSPEVLHESTWTCRCQWLVHQSTRSDQTFPCSTG